VDAKRMSGASALYRIKHDPASAEAALTAWGM
jgi:hypothetical protein